MNMILTNSKLKQYLQTEQNQKVMVLMVAIIHAPYTDTLDWELCIIGIERSVGAVDGDGVIVL